MKVMEIRAIVDKIHKLEAKERRTPREELFPLRRNLMSWYSRLAQEIMAARQRRLNELAVLVPREQDAEKRWRLMLEQKRLVRELSTLNIEAEMTALLQ
jgi:hypothetical protein